MVFGGHDYGRIRLRGIQEEDVDEANESMVLEERIASEAQRLKLKYFGDRFLEMAIPAPVEVEKDFYYKWRLGPLHLYQLYGGGGYRRGGDGSGGGELRILYNKRGYRREVGGIDESISLEYFDGDVRSNISEGFLCYLSQLEYGLSLPLTNLAKGVMNAIGECPVQMNGNMWEVITVCDHLNDKWEREKKVRRMTSEDVLQFYGVKNFKASEGSYFCASVTRCRFFNLNSAGQTWNDDIIWAKGNCLQRDDETLLDLQFRSVKPSVKSTVERKEFLLDEVAKEETELKLVLGELGVRRKKRVESKSKKVVKAHSTRSMTGVDEGKRQTSGAEAQAKTPGLRSLVQPNLATNKIAQKFMKRHKKGFAGLWYHWEDVELPKGGNEKVVREMSFRINDLESGLARERETSKALLSAQAKLISKVSTLYAEIISMKYSSENGLQTFNLKVELDTPRIREDHALMYNREFAEQFDKMKEANENRED
ncbi:hypothetical protein GIB67_021018 [Kingdonia uniflora]|uniref:Uncharacterized protein n=1 Tax=Kingdonia uniflora TaxID=39325 RepID=A0A7J7N6L5_9MAGN|nr:hypothetical protein GIB67_021018 [Kingdonia uniflora]